MAEGFRDLIVWQRSVQMAVAIYDLTKSFPKEELYGLTSQLRRAGVSVASLWPFRGLPTPATSYFLFATSCFIPLLPCC